MKRIFRRNKPAHFIRVEFDGYNETAHLFFICKAKSDAQCHMVCPNECEECDHPRTQQVPYCNDGEYINNSDSVIMQADKQPPLTLPVDTHWDGDTYVWAVRS